MKKIFICVLLCAVFLTGCIKKPEIVKHRNEDKISINLEEIRDKVKNEYLKNIQISNNSENNYFYSQLNQEEQNCYDIIVNGCKNFNSDIVIEPIEKESFYKVQSAVISDHPEFFWINHFSADYIDNNYFKVHYTTDEETKNLYNELDSIAQSIISQSPPLTYEKLKYFYDYIIDNTEYCHQENIDQDIRSVFIDKKSVCAGYSKAFKYLCDKSNIECIYVSGISLESNDNHAWNAVKLNDKWYWVDCTWGDPIYVSTPRDPITNYDYFLVDDTILNKTHKINGKINMDIYNSEEEVFKYPECTDNSLYYYTLEGNYFETYDKKKVNKYVFNNLNKGEPITLKFSNKEIFKEAYDDIFNNKGIEKSLIDYYGKHKNIRYKVKTLESYNIIEIIID